MVKNELLTLLIAGSYNLNHIILNTSHSLRFVKLLATR